MLFNSLEFILFFPIVCLVYYLLPGIKGRTIFLLLASYYFYMCWEPVYALLLLTSTSITYISALCMDRFRSRRRRKISLFSGIFINLGILFCGFVDYRFFLSPKYRNRYTSMERAIAGGNFVLYISSCRLCG